MIELHPIVLVLVIKLAFGLGVLTGAFRASQPLTESEKLRAIKLKELEGV